jgi:electron transfer flavoprotein alpha subunit
MLLVIAEHDRGALSGATLEALTFGRTLAEKLGQPLGALTIGANGDDLVLDLALYGATVVHQAHHEALNDYGPETWGATVAAAVAALNPFAVLACGTDRGNEVLAQAAARLDLPMVANCTDVEPATERGGDWKVTRVRWGGSLMERAVVASDVVLFSVAHHAVAAEPLASAVDSVTSVFTPELDSSLTRTIVAERVTREAGVTLSTAPVVVGGGRGVGSPEGFAPLTELAGLLGGVVGCSRAVTNSGWRNHTDQVGQTGTRIAPDIYIACGISGAIQHWVGAMASKKILAINTDPEANMVSRADYAVIGDLHQVVPAISAEIRRRTGA